MKYSFFADQLREFLADKNIILEVKSSARIISFATKFEHPATFNLQQQLKSFNNFFHFVKPSDDFSFIAAGELVSISENGDGRWTANDKAFRQLQSKIISNWKDSDLRIPLFVGGMKFTVEHNDADWKDFNDSDWIMPEIILLRDKRNEYAVFNFYFARNTDIQTILSDIEQKLGKLLENNLTEELPPLRIYSVTGQGPKDKKKWKNLVSRALDHIQESGVNKIVLSRKVEITLGGEPLFNNIINELTEKYPDCGIFIFKKNSSVFFGASPERLISFSGNNISVDALAGSAADTVSLYSDKNKREHDFVVEYLTNILSPQCNRLELTRHHDTKKLNNILHIWSEISAELKDNSAKFLTMKSLFPTPAVCGVPKESAIALIKKLEDHRRGLYSGIIGWSNFNNSEFFVAIRSGLYKARKIVAYAGCGIVEGSNPDEEYNETELKLIPILTLFNNENKNQPQYTLG